MSDLEPQLDELRRQIGALDDQIVRQLNSRAKLVVEIGRLKARSGVPVFAPDREREVLDRIRGCNAGPLSDRTLAAIYRELMSGSFVLERPPRVAYLGPPGTFSHLAAVRKFGSTVEFEPLAHIQAVFDEIERERVDLGIVPIENTLGGGVIDTLDAFPRHEVSICAEIHLAIHHDLLGRGPLEGIERVYSKPEALRQCQRWLVETGLFDKTMPVSSTSRAAEMASQEPGAAAIGSRLAGELFGLTSLRSRIEDEPDNTTRFLVISRQSAGPTGKDKTSILFETADKPGALVEVLDIWRQANLNMTFIESRPSRQRKWAYSFFVDLEGHAEVEPVEGSIAAARRHCAFFRVLGSFPRADEVLH